MQQCKKVLINISTKCTQASDDISTSIQVGIIIIHCAVQ